MKLNILVISKNLLAPYLNIIIIIYLVYVYAAFYILWLELWNSNILMNSLSVRRFRISYAVHNIS